MKLLLSLTLSLISTLAYADSGRGCLVMYKKQLLVDVECKCLQSKSCATIKPLKYDEKFYNSKNESGGNLFQENEKKAYKLTHELYNKISELKSVGKGDSEEIKNYYFQLDKVNHELAILQHKNHKAIMDQAKKKFAEGQKKRAKQRDRVKERIKQFLANPDMPVAQLKPEPEPIQQAIKADKNNSAPVLSASAGMNTSVPSRSGSSEEEEEKKFILNNLDREKYEINEEDSIFDIITKTYKKRAYKKLLEP